MKAICVTPERTLEVRDIPSPAEAAPGHLLVDMEASAINHGDKTFLRLPNAAGAGLPAVGQGVWGASGAGTVRAIGAGVPADYLGRQVAIYRSLTRSAETIGLWSEQAQVPWTSCLILPQTVRARDYCGSLVNVMTAHAFLEEIVAAGHRGVIVTAGNSATGRALGALARARKLPAILLVRHAEAAEALRREGEPHVVAAGEGLVDTLAPLAETLGATAVFDGVGGALASALVPALPMHSTLYAYGFLDRAAPFSIPTSLLMMKDLTLRRFSNFESATVREPQRLAAALRALEAVIGDPVFRTRLGEAFAYEHVEQAMALEAGRKAVLLARA
ncbi:Zn-dependent oxidoreductase [Burkholderia gladioli]|uniref:Zn-dependent oxidoreductase n=1 Tax=Burkholderia gladioli TaxID=28095 RepID=UPI000D008C91|nr:Zn-dependent oxidoreductase [Burkholderia gladioli]MBU9175338.1 Zn-dependent oxidoreductase [Burkholderia gladioli]MBU9274193.1 Zn-dependent oxidoreductase [Burkholderia gladioli]MBU9682567.1 Zn-dependent oxidoreductase [Burkholderia gladioli]PRE25396.1 Zn-dependent oxidoreductase [Burkholderia gladioli]